VSSQGTGECGCDESYYAEHGSKLQACTSSNF
jgi:hypothetical protein